jgi:hypothetical protein
VDASSAASLLLPPQPTNARASPDAARRANHAFLVFIAVRSLFKKGEVGLAHARDGQWGQADRSFPGDTFLYYDLTDSFRKEGSLP